MKICRQDRNRPERTVDRLIDQYKYKQSIDTNNIEGEGEGGGAHGEGLLKREYIVIR